MNITVLAILIGGLVFLAGGALMTFVIGRKNDTVYSIGGLFIAIGLCMIIVAGVFLGDAALIHKLK
jgi:hypothetical protein